MTGLLQQQSSRKDLKLVLCLVSSSGEQSEAVCLSALDCANARCFCPCETGEFAVQLRSFVDLDAMIIRVVGRTGWYPNRITVIATSGPLCGKAWTTRAQDIYQTVDGTQCATRSDLYHHSVASIERARNDELHSVDAVRKDNANECWMQLWLRQAVQYELKLRTAISSDTLAQVKHSKHTTSPHVRVHIHGSLGHSGPVWLTRSDELGLVCVYLCVLYAYHQYTTNARLLRDSFVFVRSPAV